MKEFDLDTILRKNIQNLIPYSSARDEYKGKEGIFLDANENSYGSPLPSPTGGGPGVRSYNRYPDPLQLSLKEKISKIKGLPVENIFLGNGSDEAIDILFRAFCRPAIDNVIICPPTYGMYEVSANINDVEVRKVNLIPETFQLNKENILKAINLNTKLIFVCCPNNPTGNGVKWAEIKKILDNFTGIVVIDEAYINFASYRSLIPELLNYPNLVILQTLSKAWGLAGLRVGMAFASQQIIDVFNRVKPPYNINIVSQQIALEALDNIEQINSWIKTIVAERELVSKELAKFKFVKKVYPSEANFILTKVDEPQKLYNYLVQKQIVVRDRSKVALCEGCLRITVGTQEENKNLLNALNSYA
ncbi:MAG TPA: histidinol-phosphate transaminase [Bacteroidia bacterium]|jgi:histidinol-phosphate aminotransferase|nr:histidinol-phosphate transaminase [Bacteroidia bacterium]